MEGRKPAHRQLMDAPLVPAGVAQTCTALLQTAHEARDVTAFVNGLTVCKHLFEQEAAPWCAIQGGIMRDAGTTLLWNIRLMRARLITGDAGDLEGARMALFRMTWMFAGAMLRYDDQALQSLAPGMIQVIAARLSSQPPAHVFASP